MAPIVSNARRWTIRYCRWMKTAGVAAVTVTIVLIVDVGKATPELLFSLALPFAIYFHLRRPSSLLEAHQVQVSDTLLVADSLPVSASSVSAVYEYPAHLRLDVLGSAPVHFWHTPALLAQVRDFVPGKIPWQSYSWSDTRWRSLLLCLIQVAPALIVFLWSHASFWLCLWGVRPDYVLPWHKSYSPAPLCCPSASIPQVK